MGFYELAKQRHSVRRYKTDKVEKEKLERLLEVARLAPTACNNQPQRIVVVQEKEGLDRLKKGANVYGAPLAFIVCSDKNVAWIRQYDSKDSADIDASIVTAQMMFEATELGLGTLWVCYFNPEVIRKEFNIPDNMQPINILGVGYAAGAPASPDRHNDTRKPLSEIVFYNSF